MTQSKLTEVGTAGGVGIVVFVTVVAFSTYGWLRVSEQSEPGKAHAATPADDQSARSIAYDAPAEAVEESPTGDAPAVEPSLPEKASETTVPFQTIAKGTKSGIKSGERLCITEEGEWLGVWRRHLAGSLQTEPCPSVDFEHDMVLAIFQGEGENDSGFVEIEKVKQLPDKILVVLKRSDAKSPTSEGERATTTSFHIARVTKSSLPVVFE